LLDARLGQTDIEVLWEVAPALDAHVHEAVAEGEAAIERANDSFRVQRRGDGLQDLLILRQDGLQIVVLVKNILDDHVSLVGKMLPLRVTQCAHCYLLSYDVSQP